jgi:membrane-associated protease RseP (regulator of RpoE activity)
VEPAPRPRPGDPLPPPESEAYRSVLTEYRPPRRERYGLHALLFVVTLASTVVAGGLWAGRFAVYEAEGWAMLIDPAFLADGIRYAFPFLLFLTVHEFGHYFTARRHGVDVSLPYYIPFPPPLVVPSIGTFGAVIRIREPIQRTRQLFDIGVAGPLAGFVVALCVLIYAVATLPPPTYVFDLGVGHEAIQEYVRQFGTYPTEPLHGATSLPPMAVGATPLFALLQATVPNFPPAWELYHYPVLFAGWLGLFFTALNLLPVGQLDGGHVTYALFGQRWHARIARATVLGLLFAGGVGAVADFGHDLRLAALELGYPEQLGPAAAWLLVVIVLRVLVGKLFASPFLMRAVWLGLVAAVALADIVGGVADKVGWTGWLLWSALIVYVIKVDHPPVMREEKLSPARTALGVAALVIFVLCFSPRPLYFA